MDGPTFGAASWRWLHSAEGLARLGLNTPAGLAACGLVTGTLLGSGVQALTGSAATAEHWTPASFRAAVNARRPTHGDVTMQRKIERCRAEVAALRASAAARPSEHTPAELAEIREQVKAELRARMRAS